MEHVDTVPILVIHVPAVGYPMCPAVANPLGPTAGNPLHCWLW